MNSTIDSIIHNAIEEDMPKGDVTSEALFNNETSTAFFLSKATGIISGVHVAKWVFELVDPDLVFEAVLDDGDQVFQKMLIAKVQGKTLSILKGERISLNLMQRMSGIATATNALVNQVNHTKCQILDTRKTVPGLRILDKQAVRHGRGVNHRFSLSDMVLIKDNHIHAAGSISQAVKKARETVQDSMPIEIEVETIHQFEEALNTSADRIMLDNMDNTMMRTCVQKNEGKKILEASGNMSLRRAKSVAETGVDFISFGEITHSVKAFDISVKFEKGDEPSE
jgi:nicotinate-nucleotide pyrophosphorylase (carboxylating)